MPWQIKLAKNNSYVEITYSGVITPQELEDALQTILKIGRENGSTRILADCTGMTGGHSVFDLYHLIALYDKARVPREMKEAVLLPALPGTLEEVKFYETASLNEGYNVRLFDDADAARSWLCA